MLCAVRTQETAQRTVCDVAHLDAAGVVVHDMGAGCGGHIPQADLGQGCWAL